MLEKLTPEHKRLMSETREEWLRFYLSGDNSFDEKSYKKHIEFYYNRLGLKKPQIICTKNLWEMQLVANSKINPDICKHNENDYHFHSQIFGKINRIDYTINRRFVEEVFRSVEHPIYNRVHVHVHKKIRNLVLEQLISQGYYHYSGSFAAAYSADWASKGDFYRKIGLISDFEFDTYVAYLKTGVFYEILLDGLVLACPRPNFVCFDDNGELHNETTYAISWEGGHAYQFWHGAVGKCCFSDELDLS